jgi:hypothetical protein
MRLFRPAGGIVHGRPEPSTPCLQSAENARFSAIAPETPYQAENQSVGGGITRSPSIQLKSASELITAASGRMMLAACRLYVPPNPDTLRT